MPCCATSARRLVRRTSVTSSCCRAAAASTNEPRRPARGECRAVTSPRPRRGVARRAARGGGAAAARYTSAALRGVGGAAGAVGGGGRLHGGVAANARAAALPYVDPYIFLFAGGMAIAAAMQQHDLHRRLALSIMVRVG